MDFSNTIRSKLLPALAAFALFFVVSAAYFAPQFRGEALPQHDVIQYEGMAKDISDMRAATGEDPQWTGGMFGGMPAYLINVAYPAQLVKRTVGQVVKIIDTPAGFLFFAMVSMWLMLLIVGINPWVGIVAALAYGLSTYFLLIIGAGPTGICTLLCALLQSPKRIIVCEKDPQRLRFVQEHYPQVLTVEPEKVQEYVRQNSDHGGADVVLEVAGTEDTFRMAWQCARPNAVVTIVALYNGPQTLPLQTGGVDGCDCAEILKLIEAGKIDTTPLITHTFPFKDMEAAYDLFENRRDGVIKVAIQGGSAT